MEVRYFIALIPPDPLAEQVTAFKEYFQKHYNSGAALRSPPHITLMMPFLKKERDEPLMFGILESFVQGKQSFRVCIDGFDVFEPRVIYLSVQENEQLQSLQRDLFKTVVRELKLSLLPQKRPFHPHITVAFRDLRKPAFYQAWEEFKTKTVTADFEAGGIWLLKHDGKRWHAYRYFSFTL